MMKLLAALLLLVACTDNDRTPDPRVLALGHAAAPAASSGSCDQLVAPAIAERYLTGFTRDERKLPGGTTRCKYGRQSGMIDLTFHCSDQGSLAWQTVRGMFKDAQELPGIGRGAIRIMGGVIQFWDDDTNCMVTIGAMGSGTPNDLPQFARELAASITPASLE